MCDTLIATPAVTADQVMLFGKNSDRQRNEAQVVEILPGADHAADEHVRCTYIDVPQARRTHTVLFCRPFWVWGPEMGANDRGVVIGNEAVHARRPAARKRALLGMDLAGLALQRAASAREAIEVMAGLLAAYGQGGDAGHIAPSYYNNSYIIADRDEAFVLETLDREWMVERVAQDRAISNRYSIRSPERQSEGLIHHVQGEGGTIGADGYAAAIADPARQHLGDAAVRERRASALLAGVRGKTTAAHFRAFLRDHGEAGEAWSPRDAGPRTICMHAGDHDRGGQTTGAMVSEGRGVQGLHWVTASAAPCLSLFKPVLLDVTIPSGAGSPGDRFADETHWWRHETLHRRALAGDFPEVLGAIRVECDSLEAAFERRALDALDGGRADRARVVADCWRIAAETERRWRDAIQVSCPPADDDYAIAWSKFDRLAGIPIASTTVSR